MFQSTSTFGSHCFISLLLFVLLCCCNDVGRTTLAFSIKGTPFRKSNQLPRLCHGGIISSIFSFLQENNDRITSMTKLSSLLDDAILLHSQLELRSNDVDEERQLNIIIEEIAIAMKIEHDDDQSHMNIMGLETLDKTIGMTVPGSRSINEVGNDLDQAVLHLRALASQDEEEKWTKMIENLATEYHILLDTNATLSTSSIQENEKENHISTFNTVHNIESKLDAMKNNGGKINVDIGIDNEVEIVELPQMRIQVSDSQTSMAAWEGVRDTLDTEVADTNTVPSSTSNVVSSSLPEQIAVVTQSENDGNDVEEVDIAIIGAGIGGLCAGAILNTLYNKKVGIYESHYLPGGCAHAFPSTTIVDKDNKKEKLTFTFDSGPTIVLGCSTKPYNPLRQVLNAVGLSDEVEWIPYQG
jgi:hypothetical protein